MIKIIELERELVSLRDWAEKLSNDMEESVRKVTPFLKEEKDRKTLWRCYRDFNDVMEDIVNNNNFGVYEPSVTDPHAFDNIRDTILHLSELRFFSWEEEVEYVWLDNLNEINDEFLPQLYKLRNKIKIIKTGPYLFFNDEDYARELDQTEKCLTDTITNLLNIIKYLGMEEND